MFVGVLIQDVDCEGKKIDKYVSYLNIILNLWDKPTSNDRLGEGRIFFSSFAANCINIKSSRPTQITWIPPIKTRLLVVNFACGNCSSEHTYVQSQKEEIFVVVDCC